MVAITTKKLATYADLEALPDNVVGEIIGGELIVSPRPRPAHANAIYAIGGALRDPFHEGHGGPGGWVLLPEPEVTVAAETAIPDVGGWRDERWPRPAQASISVAPDWVCEILSPSTERLDRTKKLDLYARWGVGHVWLLDVDDRYLEVFRLVDRRWMLLGTFTDEAPVRVPPFEAIELTLNKWWPSPAKFG